MVVFYSYSFLYKAILANTTKMAGWKHMSLEVCCRVKPCADAAGGSATATTISRAAEKSACSVHSAAQRSCARGVVRLPKQGRLTYEKRCQIQSAVVLVQGRDAPDSYSTRNCAADAYWQAPVWLKSSLNVGRQYKLRFRKMCNKGACANHRQTQ